jgi:hypothetical protein
VSFAVSEVSKISLLHDDLNVSKCRAITAWSFVSRTYDLEALSDVGPFVSKLVVLRYYDFSKWKSAKLCPVAISEIYKPVFSLKNGITSVSIDNRSYRCKHYSSSKYDGK